MTDEKSQPRSSTGTRQKRKSRPQIFYPGTGLQFDGADHHADEIDSIPNGLRNEEEHCWRTNALKRPYWEPPILDYRKYEEGGAMYDSLHRHPDTRPEQWYEYTDVEIETELLGDYGDWLSKARREAATAGNEERMKFYDELSHELDKDRAETDWKFGEIRERMYVARRQGAIGGMVGRRVQEQFDAVRKAWRGVDSDDSDWDEREWEIFSEREQNLGPRESQLAVTEANMRRLRLRQDSDAEGVLKQEIHHSNETVEQDAAVEVTNRPNVEVGAVEKRIEEEHVSGSWGFKSCFMCCFR